MLATFNHLAETSQENFQTLDVADLGSCGELTLDPLNAGHDLVVRSDSNDCFGSLVEVLVDTLIATRVVRRTPVVAHHGTLLSDGLIVELRCCHGDSVPENFLDSVLVLLSHADYVGTGQYAHDTCRNGIVGTATEEVLELLLGNLEEAEA